MGVWGALEVVATCHVRQQYFKFQWADEQYLVGESSNNWYEIAEASRRASASGPPGTSRFSPQFRRANHIRDTYRLQSSRPTLLAWLTRTCDA
jgi:hypothetical protein